MFDQWDSNSTGNNWSLPPRFSKPLPIRRTENPWTAIQSLSIWGMFPSYQLFEQHSNPSYHTPTQDHQLYATCCEHRRQLHDSQTPEIFKPDIRHFLWDVSYFKYDIVDKIPYHQIVVRDESQACEWTETVRCSVSVRGFKPRPSRIFNSRPRPRPRLSTLLPPETEPRWAANTLRWDWAASS